MTEFKGTPGPWTYEYKKTSIGGCFVILPMKACLYVDGMYDYAKDDPGYDEPKANVKAMTASVDMLEALNQINELCGTVNFSSHNQMREAIEGAVELSQTAIQKAIGEPNQHSQTK